MSFDLEQSILLLQKMPGLLRELLTDLPESLLFSNEGPGTWSPYDVLGHLIHGEVTDYIPRAKIILEEGESRPFEPFNREAMLEGERKTYQQLLDEFERLRESNLQTLRNMKLTKQDFTRKGTHPALGSVTLGELLATWVAHDLDHVVQILRTIGKQHDVGPWKQYLSIFGDRSQ